MLAPNPQPPSLLKRLTMALAPMPRARPFSEMGSSGTVVNSGYIRTREKSAKWTGWQRYVTIADMAVNTSIVAAGVHYFLNMVAHPNWTIKPADENDAEAVAAAELVEGVLYGMSRPWSRIVRRAATYRFYGFGIQEWTAARKPDGTIGLASIEPRPQHTIDRWAVSDAGDIEGVYQRDVLTGKELPIPRAKLLYLVDDTLSDSPEGVGMFRHLAEPWERLKTYYDLEARAFERDLRGIPVGRVPYSLINAAVKEGTITAAKAAELVKTVEDFVQIAIKESNTGITLDSAPYESLTAGGVQIAGSMQYGLELLSGGASGMGEVASAITRTQTEMARVLTCEHLMMGESSGNRSLGEDKSKNLYLVANGVLTDIAAAVDRDVVAVVCDLNGIPEDKRPYCEVEDVAFKDAEMVSGVLARMAQAGAVLAPDDPVVEDVRSLMGVSAPKPPTPEMLGLPSAPPTDAQLAADAAAGTDSSADPNAAPKPGAATGVAKVFFKENPNHDPQTGEFSSGDGGSGGGTASALRGTGPSGTTKADLTQQIADNEKEQEDLNDASMSDNSSETDRVTLAYQALEAINYVMKNDIRALNKPEIARQEKFLYGKTSDGIVVAAIQYRQSGDSIKVVWLGSQVKGKGAVLLDHAEADAKKIGAKEIAIEAKWGSEKFYARRGYQPTGDNNPLADWVGMVKKLPVKKVAGPREDGDEVGETLRSLFTKYNENHDERGLFASGDGGGSSGSGGGVSSGGAAVAFLGKTSDPSMTIEKFMSGLTPHQREMVDAANAGIAAGTSTRTQYLQADGKYTPAREALHERIISKVFTPEAVAAAMPAPGTRPELVLTGGRPAAGKTSALRAGGIDAGPPKYIYVSADTLQEGLPGYRGDRAGLFNPEGQDIADKVEALGRKLGVNMVFDATMKTVGSAIIRTDLYIKAGYDVSAYFVHTSPQVSAQRSVERFVRSGRFVPPEISLNSVTNEGTFDTLAPKLKKWALFDNNGKKSKLIKRSW